MKLRTLKVVDVTKDWTPLKIGLEQGKTQSPHPSKDLTSSWVSVIVFTGLILMAITWNTFYVQLHMFDGP